MACGTPTVVTNQGGLWHNLTWGRDALSVDPRDSEALGHTVLQVIGFDQLARRLSRCGGETVRKRFTWTAIAAGLLRVAGERKVTAATCPASTHDAEEITADYAPGTTERISMPDGSILQLHKLTDDYDPHDRVGALHYVQSKQAAGEVVTGLLYLDANAMDCHDIMNTVDTPLNQLTEKDLCPGNAALAAVNQSFR